MELVIGNCQWYHFGAMNYKKTEGSQDSVKGDAGLQSEILLMILATSDSQKPTKDILYWPDLRKN